jgi:hypothetical protein
MMVESELATLFSKATESLGFRRRGLNWYRRGEQLYSMVNLQRSRWDDLVYVNIAFSPTGEVAGEWQAESKCSVRLRVEAIRSVKKEDLLLLSGAEAAELSDNEWRAAVIARIVDPVVGILVEAVDISSLKEILQKDVTDRVMIHREMRNLLNLSAPTEGS